MKKNEILARIDEMETMMDETITGLTSSPVRDAVRLVVPMFKDQNRIMREILAMVDKNKFDPRMLGDR